MVATADKTAKIIRFISFPLGLIGRALADEPQSLNGTKRSVVDHSARKE
jgi:hypothetical protein